MELTINRSKWLRGEGVATSRLLRSSDGKMCCLGFYALACGLKEYQIREVGGPSSLLSPPDEDGKSYNYLTNTPGQWLLEGVDRIHLMEVNDDRNKNKQYREEEIARLFARHGVTVKFI
jgi:hypothetical protein